jgi:hypothetical protein
MGNKELTEQTLAKTWKEIERESSKKWIGLNAVCTKMGIKRYHVTQLLKGEDLTKFKLRHGIQASPQEKHCTPDQLLSEYDRVVSKLKKIPTWNQIRFVTHMPDSTFKRKFGSTQAGTVGAYHKWLKKNKPRSRNLKIAEKWLKGEDKPVVLPSVVTAETSRRKSRVSEKTEGRTYGHLLGYENLVYGPANEQGVVVLFAMMSKHLQYNIEGVWGDSFPDCEAIRVEVGGKRRRVRIEFEYRSKDFVNHSHDPNGCDVLVCWKDNWKDCPPNIEVLELSKEVEKIQSTKK